MSNNTNDEKLRILQERLAQIQDKKEDLSNKEEKKEIKIPTDKFEIPKTQRKPHSFRWLKFIIIIGFIAYIGFYTYNKINQKEIRLEKTNITTEILKEKTIYKLDIDGNNIVIVGTFEDERSAKDRVNNLNMKGFKTDYFYLPNKSNSNENVYKVFIGPYEHKEERNQWTKNLELDFEIITL